MIRAVSDYGAQWIATKTEAVRDTVGRVLDEVGKTAIGGVYLMRL